MATDLSVIMILTFALWVTSPLHELQSTAAFSQTTEKINSNWEPGVNVDLAVTMQRHHLQQLFYRYGENDSLSVEGFRKLLQNIGIDKIKRVHIHHDQRSAIGLRSLLCGVPLRGICTSPNWRASVCLPFFLNYSGLSLYYLFYG